MKPCDNSITDFLAKYNAFKSARSQHCFFKNTPLDKALRREKLVISKCINAFMLQFIEDIDQSIISNSDKYFECLGNLYAQHLNEYKNKLYNTDAIVVNIRILLGILFGYDYKFRHVHGILIERQINPEQFRQLLIEEIVEELEVYCSKKHFGKHNGIEYADYITHRLDSAQVGEGIRIAIVWCVDANKVDKYNRPMVQKHGLYASLTKTGRQTIDIRLENCGQGAEKHKTTNILGIEGTLCYPVVYNSVNYYTSTCQKWFRNLYIVAKTTYNTYEDAQKTVYPDSVFHRNENYTIGLRHYQIVGNCVIYNLNVGTFIRFGEKNYYALKEIITGALAMTAQKGCKQYGVYNGPQKNR